MSTLKFCLLFAAAALLFAGCKTTDAESENLSEHPWNAQRGWEGALPSTINQGR